MSMLLLMVLLMVPSMVLSMSDMPHAFSAPSVKGSIRHQPADFYVREELSFQPGDGGEHLWLFIRKTNWNTTDLALWLAKAACISLKAVGYSGLKDRRAVTDQWFSLHLPGKPDPVWDSLPAGVEIVQSCRHTRKLNRGTHRYNYFSIAVTALQFDDSSAALLQERLQGVARRGVPNYFGEQRFGRDKGNWQRGAAWLRGEGEAPRKAQLKSFWLSAVRSGIFNAVLAERVRRDCWDTPLAGDICQPDGSRGLFNEKDEPQCAERMAAGEVHPTAPLVGLAGMLPQDLSAALEQQVLDLFPAEIAGLQAQGLESARRATRLPVRDLEWTLADDTLTLSFRLPVGAFATSVLAEIVELVPLSLEPLSALISTSQTGETQIVETQTAEIQTSDDDAQSETQR